MVIWPAFRMGQYTVNDHPYNAPQFISIDFERIHNLNPCVAIQSPYSM